MTSAARPGVATRVLATRAKRLEDPQFLTGRGRYLDDIRLPGLLHAAFVRSPHAHARLSGVDASAVPEVRRFSATVANKLAGSGRRPHRAGPRGSVPAALAAARR